MLTKARCEMGRKINSREELYDYLNAFDFDKYKPTKYSDVYFLICHGSIVEPIYFTKFEDVWFESSCAVYFYDIDEFLTDEEYLTEYINDIYDDNLPNANAHELFKHEMLMIIDHTHYSIENFQVEPFLPETLEILKPMNERECLEWVLKVKKHDEEFYND